MAGVLELARLLGLAALLLSFAIMVGRRVQLVSYVSQVGVLGLAALCQAVLQADWALVAVAVILAVQGVVIWFNHPVLHGHQPFPAAMLCGALLLVVLATASTPSDGMGVPLAIVLLGLLGAAAMSGPYGVLSLLNGVVLGLVTAPGLPLRPVLAASLVALAVLVVTDGNPRTMWVRR